ncbi:hypothetical protein AB0A74_22585 [Saccharothrix sp. NPDC042600]|uniref:hypothetical protein n=1 Tax=Saccharothrix TaxID=2071 RepID=UPI00340F30B3
MEAAVFTVTPTMLLAALGVVLGVFMVWRASVRKARAAADAARAGARAMSLIGRVLVVGSVIVGVQWVVITHAAHNTPLVATVLGLPALFTAHTVVRALTIVADGGGTTRRDRRGGRR